MSKYEIVKSLRAEIRKINRIIDHKIIMGMPYSRDARRHRFLTAQLNGLLPARQGIFSRSLGFVSMFML